MINRRTFSKAIVAGAASVSTAGLSAASASAATHDGAAAHGASPADSKPSPGLGPIHQVRTDLLDIAYHEAGPTDGKVVILAHGWPFSPDAYREVVPDLVRQGFHCYVPYLRGHGQTRFLDKDTVRSGQQAALGSDHKAFMDALNVPPAIFAGYDWGGRGANVAAALWPERCTGLVSVNSYLIQNLAVAQEPLAPAIEAGYWYFYYFLTERGRQGLTQNTKELARVVWHKNSPEWRFTEAELDRAAELFDNPDYVDVVLHCYRHRLLTAPGDPRYDELEARLLKQPPITVPAVTLDGKADGVVPPTNGTSSASHFTGPRVHHVVAGAGHNLPQERPKAFASAVLEVARL
jgi:pimeloyl-ACP methyl ester carboxylesterase